MKQGRDDYTAIYLPAGSEDRSASGFATETDAWNWIFDTQMCQSCTAERRRWLMGMALPDDSEYPACSYEWMVFPTNELDDDEEIPADYRTLDSEDGNSRSI